MEKVKFPIIRTAVVGYGLSGKVFHTPFVEGHPGFRLHTIVTSGSEASKQYPVAKINKNFDKMLDDDIDLVVLCTPHYMHYEQAKAALEAGKHVIIEKPVTLRSQEMAEIAEKAKQRGLMVFPYHNRRWDGDFLTLRKIMEEGKLGDVIDFESHFDRFQPEVSRAEWRYTREDGGGTLYDLGPHLIDQAICLFGKPKAVNCMLYFQREDSLSNDSFDLKLIYPKTTATLRASVFVLERGPRFQVHGTLGSYIKHGLDTQEAALKKGKKPGNPGFGKEPKKMYGILNSFADGENSRSRYPTLPGNYMGFYDDVLDSIRGKKTPEVSPADAILNLQIIEAAIRSHDEKTVISL